jgi:hypothetical protein
MRIYCNLSPREAKGLLCGLVLFELVLVLIFALDDIFSDDIHHIFDLDAEANIPTWFSSIQLFLIGLIFFLGSRRPTPDPAFSRTFLLFAAAGFMFLSVDEAASIHEQLGGVLNRNVEFMPQFKYGLGSWIFFYLMIGMALCLVCFRVFISAWYYYRTDATILAIGMVLFLIGAVGFEVVSYEFLRDGSTPILYEVEVAIEEFLEMFGASVMFFGAIRMLFSEPGVER